MVMQGTARSGASQGYSSRTKSSATSGSGSASRGYVFASSGCPLYSIGGAHDGTAAHGAFHASTIKWKREVSEISKVHGQVVTFRYNDIPETPEQRCRERIDDALEIDDYDDLKAALEECKDPTDMSSYLVTTRDVSRLHMAIRKHLVRELKGLRAQCAEESDPGKQQSLEGKIRKKVEELKIHGASRSLIAAMSAAQRKKNASPAADAF